MLKDQQFVLAATSLGYSHSRVMFRHILPNVIRPNLVFSTLDIVLNILVLASLSFLGLGVQPPAAEWGLMVAEGQTFLLTAWWISTLPGPRDRDRRRRLQPRRRRPRRPARPRPARSRGRERGDDPRGRRGARVTGAALERDGAGVGRTAARGAQPPHRVRRRAGLDPRGRRASASRSARARRRGSSASRARARA